MLAHLNREASGKCRAEDLKIPEQLINTNPRGHPYCGWPVQKAWHAASCTQHISGTCTMSHIHIPVQIPSAHFKLSSTTVTSTPRNNPLKSSACPPP
eukprot:12802-Pelagomonas_calceolata.AAC.3